jgi:hypothetical protein
VRRRGLALPFHNQRRTCSCLKLQACLLVFSLPHSCSHCPSPASVACGHPPRLCSHTQEAAASRVRQQTADSRRLVSLTTKISSLDPSWPGTPSPLPHGLFVIRVTHLALAHLNSPAHTSIQVQGRAGPLNHWPGVWGVLRQ